MLIARKFILIPFCLYLLLMWTGCGSSDADETSPVIVSYKETDLTQRMLEHYIPDGVTEKDSARYAEQFLRQWVKEQAIMDVATKQDPKLSARIEYKVQDYRAKLIMHEYHSRLISESLETDISEAEIMAYYELNKENFRSKENLYSYFYVVSTKRDVNEQATLMRSATEESMEKLRVWAEENSREYKLDSQFVGVTKINHVSKGYFGNLQKAQAGKFIRWNGVIQGERRRYLFKMLDVVKEGEPLPIRLCRDKISNLIINNNKNELIELTEDKILRTARAKNFIREQ